MSLVSYVQEKGKGAGIAVIAVGIALVPAGYWLAFVMPGPDYYWPYMLVVSAFGFGMIGVGLSTFYGAGARMAALSADLDLDLPPTSEAGSRERVEKLPLPFWACGSCKHIGPGIATADRCMNCGDPTNFAQVNDESERAMAVAILG